jgi:hypothetical protein
LRDGKFIPHAILRFTSTPHQHHTRKTAFARIHVQCPASGGIRGQSTIPRSQFCANWALTLFGKVDLPNLSRHANFTVKGKLP